MHTQIPVELLIANGFPKEPLCYRIFLKISDGDLTNKLEQSLECTGFRYLPFLGNAPFTNWIEWLGSADSATQVETDEPVIVESVAGLPVIERRSLKMEPINDVLPAYHQEHVRREFLPGREPGEVLNVVWERNRGKLRARFIEFPYRLRFGDTQITVSFL